MSLKGDYKILQCCPLSVGIWQDNKSVTMLKTKWQPNQICRKQKDGTTKTLTYPRLYQNIEMNNSLSIMNEDNITVSYRI